MMVKLKTSKHHSFKITMKVLTLTAAAVSEGRMSMSSTRRSSRTRTRRRRSSLFQAGAGLSNTTTVVMRMLLAVFFLLAALIPGCGGSFSISNYDHPEGDAAAQDESNSPVDYISSSSSGVPTDTGILRCMSSKADEESSSSPPANKVMCTFSLDAEQIQQTLIIPSATVHQGDVQQQQQQEKNPRMKTTTLTQCLSKKSLYGGDINNGNDDEEEYCIQAEIKVMSKAQLLEQQQQRATTSSNIFDAADDEDFYDEEVREDEYDDEAESHNDDTTTRVETDEKTAADMPVDESTSSSSQSTATDNFTITVGTTVYTLPYSQYGTHVARVLRGRHRPKLNDEDGWDDDGNIIEQLLLHLQDGKDGLSSSSEKQNGNKDDHVAENADDVLLIQKGRSLLKRARWCQKLGLAHRIQLEEGYKSLEMLKLQGEQGKQQFASNGSDKKRKSMSLQEQQEAKTKYMQDQVNFSIQAFNTAVQLNQQASLLQSSSSTTRISNENSGSIDDKITHDSLVDGSSPLAILYYHIAETFALSPNPDQAALAQDYRIQSEQLFRRILHNQNEATYNSSTNKNKGHDLDFMDMQLSWAQCCLRLGVTLLNQSNGLAFATTTDTTTATTTNRDDSTKQQQQPISKSLKPDYIMASTAAAAAAEQGQHTISLSRKFLEMVDRSEAFFLQAERILRRAVEQETARRNDAKNSGSRVRKQQYQQENRRIASRDVDSPVDAMDRLRPEKHFATALHNLASTALYKSDYAKSTMYLEEARQVYQTAVSVLEKPQEHDLPQTLVWTNYDAVIVEVQLAMGEILYSLADVYLQQGKLHNAKNRYTKAMDWFEQHKIAPPATLTATLGGGGGVGDQQQSPLVSFILEDADGNVMGSGGAGGGDDGGAADLLGGLAASVAEHERALEEYNEMFADGLNEATAYMDENIQVGDEEYYYAKNDGYEGDLHTNLGTMYMAMGDDLQARSHFTQAMRLYSMSGEQGERTMADVKFNMAILAFRLGEYSESSQLYEEALDIFLELFGEGVNPMLMTLQEHDQTTFSSATGTTTSKTKSTYYNDAKEKPTETEVKLKKDVTTSKSTTTKKYDNGEDKHKIHVDLASFQKKGMLLNETRSDEL